MRTIIIVTYVLNERRPGDAFSLVDQLAGHELIVPITDHEIDGIGPVGVDSVTVRERTYVRPPGQMRAPRRRSR